MSGSHAHSGLRRVLPAATAFLLSVSALVAVAPAADATGSLVAQYTASVSLPGAPPAVAATVGAPVALGFTVKNTSTYFAPMGKVVLTAPAGVALAAPTVNRSGWTAAVAGQTVTAAIARPLSLVGLRPGQSLTVSVTATFSPATVPEGAAQAVTTWPVKGFGFLGYLPFAQQGPTPVVTVVPKGFVAVAAQPNVPLGTLTSPDPAGDACTLSSDKVCSEAELAKGANGTVSFGQRVCPTVNACGVRGVEVELNGTFTDASGALLYGPDAPASVTITCLEALCFHKDGLDATVREDEPTDDSGNFLPYDYNYSNPYAGDEREVEEDFRSYPVYVQLKNSTGFVLAERCVPKTDLETTGVILTGAQFCVDVNAITRAENSFTGDLSIPVLFFDDPKMR